ncbi:hypothetical protein NI17_005280 [Thermobifida halotolerans]|uniref:Uncharacterized protein n=1 Tax=Thermobifida halotolerans TaxID=483545 RepID=A0A399G941_9ACTN|nr:hypothetical protein [Thermobifida halotolerans]UOE20629.1 hypothetical protein NI17_005280 [Thermobifida halotolerans]
MNDSRRLAIRRLVAEPRQTEESRKLLVAEMERLGAPSARAAVRCFDARRAVRDASALRRLFSRRHR